MILLGIGVVLAVFVVIVICRLLARCIRDINTWDRRSGGYDKD
jgi:hypothetical protein